MPKEILSGKEGRERLQAGVDKLANVVKVTLGAKGSNVIINNGFESPAITKDGVTVAKSIELPDRIENMGALLVKEVASKTASVAGDGTTTSVVLAQAMISQGNDILESGTVNKMDIKRGMDKAVVAVVEELKKLSSPAEGEETLNKIATISANGDVEIGKLISETFAKVGKNGRITQRQSMKYETEVDVVDGIQIDRTYISPAFMTDSSKQRCELADPKILIHENSISSVKETSLLMAYCASNKIPLLIIAEDVEGETLQTMIVNKIRGGWNCCAIKSPSFGDTRKEVMQDIAIATGATYITNDSGIKLGSYTKENIQELVNYLGSAKSITIDKDSTVIVGGGGSPTEIKKRIAAIEYQVKGSKSELEANAQKDRLAKLSNGIAVLKVGGTTDTEIQERMDRIDDALCATRAAMEEGYVVGGGVTYIKCVDAIKDLKGANADEDKGIHLVFKSLVEPFSQILHNAGLPMEENYRRVLESDYGWGMNVKTDVFENLLDAGVIDPTKVTRVALENAASIAAIFLTTESVLSEIQP